MINPNSKFFAILTTIGEAKLANATALGIPWLITDMGVGDANDTDPLPDRLQTALINERRRAPLNQLRGDPANPGLLIAEQVLPADVGGWWVRELGLYDADGDLVAVCNCAPSYKPLLEQGSGRTQIVRMTFIVSSTANVVLKIDPSIVLATREYVDSLINGLLPADKEAGTYRQVTINEHGIVQSGSNPTTRDDYGLTDVFTQRETADIIQVALAVPIVAVTESRVLTAQDLGLVLIDASAGDLSIALPPANATLGTRDLIVRRVDNTGSRLVVQAEDSDGRTKIEQDAAKARETSNAKWSTATDSMSAMMVSIGDAVRPITNLVADGVSSLGYGLSSLSEKYPGLIRGTTLLAGGVIAAGLALNAFKIGKGLMNLGRGSLIGNPHIVQPVRVVNSAGLAGGADSDGGRGKRGKGKTRTPGSGAGRYIKGAGLLSAVSAGMQGIDTYQSAETRDEKAEGYGEAAGTFAGSLGGAAIGAAIGTAVLPVIGTAVGSIIGGMIGAWGGGAAGGSLGKAMFGNGGLDRMPAQGPLMLPNAGSQLGPRLGDVARSFEKPTDTPGALLQFKPAGKAPPAKVDQRLTFAPKLDITVQGDVKDPQQLADAMMPYLQQQFEEFAQQAERRSLFDAPHIN